MGYDIFVAGAEGASSLDWATVSSALTNVWSLVESCLNFIVSNNVFVVMFAAGLIPIGFKIFRKAKKAVK